MREFDHIVCHGSGNRFVLVDAVAQPSIAEEADPAILARELCRLHGGLDGLLLLVRVGEEYGMRMYNPDGSAAEMCGNGIRCVARLACERYVGEQRFALWSGGRRYRLSREEPLPGGIPAFGVVIPIGFASDDFVCDGPRPFVGGAVLPLDRDRRFTYLNLGNPHLVCRTDRIDLDELERAGRRVTGLPEVFPHGINLSFYRPCGQQRIFVATYERGAGITLSCGTAMTACSTAACIEGVCRYGEPIEVLNRGGMVRCLCVQEQGETRTSLIGNATFEGEGLFAFDAATGRVALHGAWRPRREETDAYAAFLEKMKNC
ncbi:diaminopimelate epimerase [uncultured Alistipes sp.]|uniref:diaminopimelate epimerase n=1 Tax=uncultured Alistipes sp. TaxID=538949 RepID=UPI00272D0CE7|nr:hypothetical protein [uncultured Alistipes sp.]